MHGTAVQVPTQAQRRAFASLPLYRAEEIDDLACLPAQTTFNLLRRPLLPFVTLIDLALPPPTHLVVADGVPLRWYPLGPRSAIVLDPLIASGVPVVLSAGVTVASVVHAVQAARARILRAQRTDDVHRPEDAEQHARREVAQLIGVPLDDVEQACRYAAARERREDGERLFKLRCL